MDEALDVLNYMLDELYPPTRSSERKIIGSIESVGRNEILRGTRSEDGMADSLIPETAYYFVNFENDGFAVLGADKRLEDVYIIAEQGSINSEIFSFITEDGEFFVNEEDYYDAELDDYLVGSIAPDVNGTNGINNTVIGGMLSDAATIASGWTISVVEGEESEVIYYTGPEIFISKSQIMHKKIAPLLTTKWKQGSPFNTYCSNGVAGCVPIAIAQIMLHHEHPYMITSNGVDLHLKDIKTVWSVNSSGKVDKKENTLVADRAARFARLIGNDVRAIYFFKPGSGDNATFAWPVDAKDALRKYGYNAHIRRGDIDKAAFITMLENDCPIFYAAHPKWRPDKAHAWVIDGYEKFTTIIKTKRLIKSSKGEYYRYSDATFHFEYFHCNWGWGGNGDGYYSLSLLNPGRGPSDTDVVDSVGFNNASSDNEYRKRIRWIYYTKPN